MPASSAHPSSTAQAAADVQSDRRPLTPSELRVLKLIGEGGTNREIAAALHLSEHTVKTHVSRMLRARGVRTRSELAASAVQDGVVRCPSCEQLIAFAYGAALALAENARALQEHARSLGGVAHTMTALARDMESRIALITMYGGDDRG